MTILYIAVIITNVLVGKDLFNQILAYWRLCVVECLASLFKCLTVLSFSQGYACMTSAVCQESCQDWELMELGGVFSLEWIHKESLPFHCTHHILNPWNDNKKVQISRDGQVRKCQEPFRKLMFHIIVVVSWLQCSDKGKLVFINVQKSHCSLRITVSLLPFLK